MALPFSSKMFLFFFFFSDLTFLLKSCKLKLCFFYQIHGCPTANFGIITNVWLDVTDWLVFFCLFVSVGFFVLFCLFFCFFVFFFVFFYLTKRSWPKVLKPGTFSPCSMPLSIKRIMKNRTPNTESQKCNTDCVTLLTKITMLKLENPRNFW